MFTSLSALLTLDLPVALACASLLLSFGVSVLGLTQATLKATKKL